MTVEDDCDRGAPCMHVLSEINENPTFYSRACVYVFTQQHTSGVLIT